MAESVPVKLYSIPVKKSGPVCVRPLFRAMLTAEPEVKKFPPEYRMICE